MKFKAKISKLFLKENLSKYHKSTFINIIIFLDNIDFIITRINENIFEK